MAAKRTKDEVHYGPGDIDGEHCGACRHFIEPATCELVEGRIRARDWCRLYAKKRAARKPREPAEAEEGEGDGAVDEKKAE